MWIAWKDFRLGCNLLRNPNLVSEEHLCGVSFPAAITTTRNHVSTGVIDEKLRYRASAMTGNDEEGCRGASRGLVVLQVVET